MGFFDSTLISGFFQSPSYVLLSIVSLFLSVLCFVYWRKKQHSALLYSHLVLLFVPVALLLVSVNCWMSVISGTLAICAKTIAQALVYLIPAGVLGALFVGYALMPLWIRVQYRARETTQFSRITGIRTFLLDSAKPLAFSTQKNIFVSVGMCELLTRKELEAVVLHEVAHVKRQSAWHKFSTILARTCSPLALFSSTDFSREEREADAFAVKKQETKRFIQNARAKIAQL